MWKSGAPVLAVLVWDGQSVADTLNGLEALDPGKRRLLLLADQPENRALRRSQNMKGICKV